MTSLSPEPVPGDPFAMSIDIVDSPSTKPGERLQSAFEAAAQDIAEIQTRLEQARKLQRFLADLLRYRQSAWILHLKDACERESDFLEMLRERSHPAVTEDPLQRPRLVLLGHGSSHYSIRVPSLARRRRTWTTRPGISASPPTTDLHWWRSTYFSPDRKFSHLRLVPASAPYPDGSSLILRRPVIDLSIPRQQAVRMTRRDTAPAAGAALPAVRQAQRQAHLSALCGLLRGREPFRLAG